MLDAMHLSICLNRHLKFLNSFEADLRIGLGERGEGWVSVVVGGAGWWCPMCRGRLLVAVAKEDGGKGGGGETVLFLVPLLVTLLGVGGGRW